MRKSFSGCFKSTCKDICWGSPWRLQLPSVRDDCSFGTTPPIWEPAFRLYGNIFNIISVFRFLSVSSYHPPPRPCPPHPNFAMCKFWAKYPLICLKFWNLSSGKFCEAHVKIKYRQHRKSLQIFWMTFYNQPQLSSASKKMNYLTLSKDFSVQGICNGLSSHF